MKTTSQINESELNLICPERRLNSVHRRYYVSLYESLKLIRNETTEELLNFINSLHGAAVAKMIAVTHATTRDIEYSVAKTVEHFNYLPDWPSMDEYRIPQQLSHLPMLDAFMILANAE